MPKPSVVKPEGSEVIADEVLAERVKDFETVNFRNLCTVGSV